MNLSRFLPVIFLGAVVFIFFWQFLFKGLLPIPSDTIIGLYHPFRDFYAKDYPNGIPFKNFLITDPVRQQYPWRELSLSIEKRNELPIWNPYSMAGTPLLANFQSSVFYPLNILFLPVGRQGLLSFNIGWSILILFGPMLAGFFLYFYLDSLKLNKWACFLGALSFSFSGFFIAWLEWGTITHTALWLPLILLSIDKIFSNLLDNLKVKSQKLLIWSIIFVFSLVSSFFAGHLQTFFYLFLLSIAYLFARLLQFKARKIIPIFLFAILYLLFIVLTATQWVPTLQLILLSAREIDQSLWQNPGWFIPWQHLIQFVVPDFFGNPTTLNYWGEWNYGEFIGYIGLLPLITAVLGLFFRHDKKTLFFGSVFFLSLIFSLPTFFAKLPYILDLPFLSTAQPTRLLFLTDFSLAVLSAFGFDYLVKSKKSKIYYPILFIALIFILLWAFIFYGGKIFAINMQNIEVARRNLIFPSLIFLISSILLLLVPIFKKMKPYFILMIFIAIVAITVLDLFRFGFKFTPFTNKEYLFPSTKVIDFLKTSGNFRVMSTDSRILPPNFSVIYRIQSVDGYDPLYLQRYAELIAASERSEPNINPPFGFNRIITPKNYESKIIDLLGVKYVLSPSDISSPKLNKVFQEGQTRVYENNSVLPRAFFADEVFLSKNKEESIKVMFNKNIDLRKTAVIEDSNSKNPILSQLCINCEAEIKYYSENKIIIGTKNDTDGFLVLTDSFYPSWHVKVNGVGAKIYMTDYDFRGVFIPKGEHMVEFYISLF